jgi:DNA-binding response OmpR family regulator
MDKLKGGMMAEKKTILLADNDGENIEFLKVMLPKLGYTMLTAADGEECCGVLEKWDVDILLLNTVLPKLSGWEILSRLKHSDSLSAIPVIMLSNIATVKDKVEAFEQGADDYIVKPYNFTELLARVRSLLRHRAIFNQLKARESRLALAEELSVDMRTAINAFIKNIDSLDEAITLQVRGVLNTETLPPLFAIVREKISVIKDSACEIDARVKTASSRWQALKQNEIAIRDLTNG